MVVPGVTKRTSRVITIEIGVVFGSRPGLHDADEQVALGEDAGDEPSSFMISTAPTSRVGHHVDRLGDRRRGRRPR